MAGIEEVMERLVTDAQFREQLATDAESALAGYDLTEDEAALLAAGLEEGGGQSRVEQRTSKAGLAGLFAEALGGGVAADRGTEPEPATGTGGLTGERGSESHVGLLLPAIQKIWDYPDPPKDVADGLSNTVLAGEVEPAESGDPDQPIVSGRVYNADTTSTGDGSDGGGSSATPRAEAATAAGDDSG